ncbi:MAG: hypothetical protein HYY04_08880 [Chloroflexi bacterium]|nr:hypothetical protein [Chloroflexota bacterium]
MSRLPSVFVFQVAVVAALGIAIGAGLAARQSPQRSTAPSAVAALVRQPTAGGVAAAIASKVSATGSPDGTPTTSPLSRSGGPGSGTAPGVRTAVQRSVVGTIETIGPNRIVVRGESGTTSATIGDSTTIRKTEAIARSDLPVGATVLVTGAAGADGAIEAASVQLVSADDALSTAGRLAGGSGGGAGAPSGSGRGLTGGAIEKVIESGFTVKTAGGTVTVKIGAATVLRRTVEADIAVLKAGERVTLAVEPGSDGTMVARSIQIGESGLLDPRDAVPDGE